MLEQEHITHAEFVRANKAPLPKPEDVQLPSGQNLKAPYFTNYVKQLLVDALRLVHGVRRRPARAHVDQPAGAAGRARRDREVARTGPARRRAALVAIDPRDGRVLAMVGGNNYRKSQFNLAVQGERQPGSSFKPFVLATALEQGVAPGTTLRLEADHAVPRRDVPGRCSNYEGAYLGTIDLQQATIHSDNSVYGAAHEGRRPGGVAQHRAPARDREPARAVPVDRARRAGGQPARDGARIRGVRERRLSHRRLARPASRTVRARSSPSAARTRPTLDCGDAHVHCNRLGASARAPRPDTVGGGERDPSARRRREGTGTRAALPDRPAAGKTGTTENYGDAWFVGYTPQLVTAVWVGYPNKLVPMTNAVPRRCRSPAERIPAMIWKTFMETALAASRPFRTGTR